MIRHKSFWEKGSGAMLSLAIASPFIVFIISFMGAAFQSSITMNRMQFAVYRCARNAVVCENMADAKNAVQKMADQIAPSAYRSGPIQSAISYTASGSNGTAIQGGNGQTTETDYEWRKGNFINVQLTGTYKLMMPFNTRTIHAYITMMIENEPHSGTHN